MIGITVFACVVLIALCSATMAENEDIYTGVQYNVQVKPGRVTYGTHSTVSVPSLSLPVHHSQAPLISGGTVRSYAHHGHATIPARSASALGKGLYTTSSATLHSVGSGGGNGGGTSSYSGGQGSSSRGISYSGGGSGLSMSMPTLAVNSSLLTTSSVSAAEASAPRAIGPRRAKPTDSGVDGEWRYGGDDPENPSDWWYYDDWEGWIAATKGDMRPAEDGNFYLYNGSEWTLVNDQGDPVNPQPLGDAPWVWIAVLAAGYCAVRVRKTKHTHCSACNAGASLDSRVE